MEEPEKFIGETDIKLQNRKYTFRQIHSVAYECISICCFFKMVTEQKTAKNDRTKCNLPLQPSVTLNPK